MTTMTHAEIISKHDIVTEDLSNFFASLSQEQFTTAINDGWSPAEHLGHLLVGYKIVGKAFTVPKTALAIRFGKRPKNKEDDNYETIISKYQAALAIGLKSPQEFVPKEDKMILDTVKAVQKLHEVADKFKSALASKWDDTNIDIYVLPHPAFEQKITVRELLYFELYHSLHHRNNVAKDLGLPESWPV